MLVSEVHENFLSSRKAVIYGVLAFALLGTGYLSLIFQQLEQNPKVRSGFFARIAGNPELQRELLQVLSQHPEVQNDLIIEMARSLKFRRWLLKIAARQL
jgi:hypothetical protein